MIRVWAGLWGQAIDVASLDARFLGSTLLMECLLEPPRTLVVIMTVVGVPGVAVDECSLNLSVQRCCKAF